MPFFICPSCGNRELSGERTAGFSARPKGCPKCGFGFLFELLDDYYPAPDAAFFTCDRQGRVIDIGRGGFELTGLTDEDAIGRPVQDVLGLRWVDAGDGGETADTDGDGWTDPIETTLEGACARREEGRGPRGGRSPRVGRRRHLPRVRRRWGTADRAHPE